MTTDQPVMTRREHRRITGLLRVLAGVMIAAMVLFAVAYAITGDFNDLAAVVIAALSAWCVSEPVKALRAETGES